MELLERLLGSMPDLLLSTGLAFQVFLFRQITECRRDLLELRVELAGNYVRTDALERLAQRVDDSVRRLEDRLETHFYTLTQRERSA
ncbi:hypothetical protein [Azotobacter vinelandii]|uniref:hypothetical protein n=1 Tax=Azotobacter vinelandii TaxID=354 RepID=UPI0007746D61|nr:hypothetical protein [Azotobacter vinelandii]WKN21496.1 hypothetical protein AVAEIV_004594 [Azotobacter vinelandii]